MDKQKIQEILDNNRLFPHKYEPYYDQKDIKANLTSKLNQLRSQKSLNKTSGEGFFKSTPIFPKEVDVKNKWKSNRAEARKIPMKNTSSEPTLVHDRPPVKVPKQTNSEKIVELFETNMNHEALKSAIIREPGLQRQILYVAEQELFKHKKRLFPKSVNN